MPPKRAAKRAKVEGKATSSSSTQEQQKICDECGKEPGTIVCRRSDGGGMLCHQDERKRTWCHSCAEKEGTFCAVCEKYHCAKCDAYNLRCNPPSLTYDQFEELLRNPNKRAAEGLPVHDNAQSGKESPAEWAEWHPEADANLYMEECDHCERNACKLFDGACYKKCETCKAVSCVKCIAEKEEKWTYCEACYEEHYNQADGFTPKFAKYFCPQCKGKECDENWDKDHETKHIDAEIDTD